MASKIGNPASVRIDSIRIRIADNGFILEWTEVVKTPGKGEYENTQWIERLQVYSDAEDDDSEIKELLMDARKLRDISREAKPESVLS